MIEVAIQTIYPLIDRETTRLQCYSLDGQPFTLLLTESQRRDLLAALQSADRVQAIERKANAILIKPQPPATRVDGWDV